MAWRDWFARERISERAASDLRHPSAPRAETWYTNDTGVPGWFTGGAHTSSGVAITKETALKVAVAFRCVKIITGVMASLPLDLMLRVDERTRKPAEGNPFRDVLTVKPNRWQTPGEFIRLMQAHLLLKGNGYAYKRMSGTAVAELIPLDPDRVRVEQKDDLTILYRYQGRTGGEVTLTQADLLHLRGLSLDGVTGLSVVAYARESLGLSIQAEKVGARVFKNGQFNSQVYQTDQKMLPDDQFKRLRAQLSETAGANAQDAGGAIVLEGGLKLADAKLSAEDLQFLEIRDFERTDVGMFFGVPPFLYGDTQKSTSWGTGIEQQNIGFLQYTIQDWITVWEEAFKRDCLAAADPKLYVHFDPKGFFQMDAATQREFFKAALGAGGSPAFMTPNEVREKLEMPPRPEPWADELPKPQQSKPGPPNDNPQTPAN